MNYHDELFINTFNVYYPFDRYILKTPKSISTLFNDILLTEIFTPIQNDTLCIKINGTIRMGFLDFVEHIREEIRYIVMQDFGANEWQDLFIECDNSNKLREILLEQKKLIKNKYGSCYIKDCINLELLN